MAIPRSASNDQRPPSALVVHGDSFIGLSIVRSIGRRGVPVTVLYRAGGLAAHSRYCSFREQYSSESDLPERLKRLIAEREITHLIATSENLITLLNRHRAELEASCTLVFPAEAVFERSLRKDQTLAIARQIGVPVPRTTQVATLADLQGCAGLSYPVAVKPRGGGAEAFKVRYCNSYAELLEFLQIFLGRDEFLVQEFIVGKGIGIEVLMRGGAPLMVFSHRRIREYPPSGGVSTCCESIEADPALAEHAVRLLRAMEWDGVAMVEFKVNSETKQAALMEVNGRFWGSLPLAVQAGADFPYELLWTANEPQLSRPFRPRYGVRSRVLVGETKWLISVLRTGFVRPGAALWQYLMGFSPLARYYCFSFEDPKPALAAIFGRLKKLLRQTFDNFRKVRQPRVPGLVK